MDREIKLVDIKAQYEEIKDELSQEWGKIFDSMYLMLGPNMKQFEKEFAEYTGTRYGMGVDSGTAALFLALKAMGIGKGDEVITVSFTFFATIEAILHCNATPVLIDIDEKTFTISVNKLNKFIEEECEFNGENLINKKTGNTIRAIIPVHIYGIPADMDDILSISKKYNLKVLEDCAQAHGAEYRGKKVGSMGDASAYSFYFSKNLSALGEGGIILTDNEDYRATVEKLRLHGQSDKFTHQMIGYNSRLDEIQSAVLRLKLRKLDKWNGKRIELADYYGQKLKDLPLVLPPSFDDRKAVYHLYVIRTKQRDKLFEYLAKNGIGVGIHYKIPSHLQPALNDLGYEKKSLSVTETLSEEILSLPMYPHLTFDDIDYISKKIKEFFG